MTLREITIGRSKNSDIYLDDRCIYASTNHATIYYDGNQMMFRDNSSNGTMINNVMVKQRAVPINRGDIIMIAGQYQLGWAQIDRFFPPSANMAHQGTAYDMPYNTNTSLHTPDLKKWNWGACGLYPIWGFFNGCWWAILVMLLVMLLCLLPFCWILSPVANIIFGLYGTRWAWENKTWQSTDEFIQTQHSWGIAGMVIFAIHVLLWFSGFFFLIALFS